MTLPAGKDAFGARERLRAGGAFPGRELARGIGNHGRRVPRGRPGRRGPC
nr:hypothetical protein [Streptomyces sp. NBC_00588]